MEADRHRHHCARGQWMGEQCGFQLDVVRSTNVAMSSRSSHCDRIQKQSFLRDVSGGRYTVTLTGWTVPINVRKDTKREHLFTNTSTIPCTVEHDLEECLQSERCFLLVPIFLDPFFPMGNQECVRPPQSFAPPYGFILKHIVDWDPSGIITWQALRFGSSSDVMPKDAIQG